MYPIDRQLTKSSPVKPSLFWPSKTEQRQMPNSTRLGSRNTTDVLRNYAHNLWLFLQVFVFWFFVPHPSLRVRLISLDWVRSG